MATLLRTVLRRVPTTRGIAPLYTSTPSQCRLVGNSKISNSSIFARKYSTSWAELPEDEREASLLKKLQTGLEAKDVNIIDLSGGCGTMYRIELSSPRFKGKSMLQQHRMVNELLADEIKNMHGLTLKTVAE